MPAREIETVHQRDELAQVREARDQQLAKNPNTGAGPELGLVFADEYIRVFRDPVKFPSGKFGTYLRIEERAIQNGVVGVVALPMLGERIFLHRIFRYPTRSWEWELPRGFLEPGHSPQEMVQRELAAETGLSAERVEELGFVFSNTGLLAGGAKVFLVQVKEVSGRPAPEEGEVIGELAAISPTKLWSMARHGEIRDGFTLSAMSLAVSKQLLPPPG